MHTQKLTQRNATEEKVLYFDKMIKRYQTQMNKSMIIDFQYNKDQTLETRIPKKSDKGKYNAYVTKEFKIY